MPGNALHQVHLHTNHNPVTSAVAIQSLVLLLLLHQSLMTAGS